MAETYNMREAEALSVRGRRCRGGDGASGIRRLRGHGAGQHGRAAERGSALVLYDQHLPKLGPRLANYLRDWYVNYVRGA